MLFYFLGIILLVLANVVSIGYGLYLWGPGHIDFSMVVWTAFKLWIVMGVSGLVSLFIGFASMER